MSRPVSDKERRGVVKVTQKNGDVYVIERITKYDPKKGYTRTVSSKLIGKIVGGEGEVQPTRSRLIKADGQNDPLHGRKPDAALLAVSEAESGVRQDLSELFGRKAGSEIRTVARFWASADDALINLPSWQVTHPAPAGAVLNEAALSSLFETVGGNGEAVRDFFRLRGNSVQWGQVVAFDLENLLVLCSGEDEPVAYETKPALLSGTASVAMALRRTPIRYAEQAVVVTDADIASLSAKGIRFLTSVDPESPCIASLWDKNAKRMTPFGVRLAKSVGITGCTDTLASPLEPEAAAGEHEIKKHLTIHLYRDRKAAERQSEELDAKIAELARLVRGGATEFTEDAKDLIGRYLEVSKDLLGTPLVTVKTAEVEDAKKRFGRTVLVSDSVNDAAEAMRLWREKQEVSRIMRLPAETRVLSSKEEAGRLFCRFVMLTTLSFLRLKIRMLRRKLTEEIRRLRSAKEDAVSWVDVRRAEALLNWLEDTGPEEMLRWFDCGDGPRIRNSANRLRWAPESRERDREFLERIGLLHERDDE
jgi:hypothetical protein